MRAHSTIIVWRNKINLTKDKIGMCGCSWHKKSLPFGYEGASFVQLRFFHLFQSFLFYLFIPRHSSFKYLNKNLVQTSPLHFIPPCCLISFVFIHVSAQHQWALDMFVAASTSFNENMHFPKTFFDHRFTLEYFYPASLRNSVKMWLLKK